MAQIFRAQYGVTRHLEATVSSDPARLVRWPAGLSLIRTRLTGTLTASTAQLFLRRVSNDSEASLTMLSVLSCI